ncbi:unnamed protein product [Ixodes persulcatus]
MRQTTPHCNYHVFLFFRPSPARILAALGCVNIFFFRLLNAVCLTQPTQQAAELTDRSVSILYARSRGKDAVRGASPQKEILKISLGVCVFVADAAAAGLIALKTPELWAGQHSERTAHTRWLKEVAERSSDEVSHPEVSLRKYGTVLLRPISELSRKLFHRRVLHDRESVFHSN